MTSFRRAIPDFQLANPLYVGAQVYVYTVDANGDSTGTLATLYASPRGTQTVTNPQVLDGDGKFARAVYHGVPIIMEVISATIGSHNTGVILPLGLWRGSWVTATAYVTGDLLISGDADFPDVYAATDVFTSSTTIAADVTAGNLVKVVDGSVLAAIRDIYADFETSYLGAKAVQPTLDNEGNALVVGALIFYTPANVLQAWNGTNWVSPSVLSHTHPQSEITDLVANLAAINTELDTKFDKAGGTITGLTDFDFRPTFDGNTPWDSGNYTPAAHGGVELINGAWAAIYLYPRDGGNIIIDGVSRKLTAPITISDNAFALDATQYVYVTWTGSAVSYVISSTGYTRQSNGVVTQTGDTSRTLVGAVHRTSTGGIQDSYQGRTSISWFHRKARYGKVFVSGSSSTMYSAAVGTTFRFIAWTGTHALMSMAGSVMTQGGPSSASVNANIYLNGGSSGFDAVDTTCTTASRQAFTVLRTPHDVTAETLVTVQGAVGTNGAGNTGVIWANLIIQLPAY